jgi:hypothetical protein
MVNKDFNGPGPYPSTHILSMFTKKPLPATPSNAPPVSTSPISAFTDTHSSTPPPPSATPHIGFLARSCYDQIQMTTVWHSDITL